MLRILILSLILGAITGLPLENGRTGRTSVASSSTVPPTTTTKENPDYEDYEGSTSQPPVQTSSNAPESGRDLENSKPLDRSVEKPKVTPSVETEETQTTEKTEETQTAKKTDESKESKSTRIYMPLLKKLCHPQRNRRSAYYGNFAGGAGNPYYPQNFGPYPGVYSNWNRNYMGGPNYQGYPGPYYGQMGGPYYGGYGGIPPTNPGNPRRTGPGGQGIPQGSQGPRIDPATGNALPSLGGPAVGPVGAGNVLSGPQPGARPGAPYTPSVPQPGGPVNPGSYPGGPQPPQPGGGVNPGSFPGGPQSLNPGSPGNPNVNPQPNPYMSQGPNPGNGGNPNVYPQQPYPYLPQPRHPLLEALSTLGFRGFRPRVGVLSILCGALDQAERMGDPEEIGPLLLGILLPNAVSEAAENWGGPRFYTQPNPYR